jgi:hypothetical protein
MKTMKDIFAKGLMAVALITLGFLSSCNDNDQFDFSANDSNNVENEAVTESYFEDVDDMSTLAVSADVSTSTGSRESASGREGVKPSDARFTCAVVKFEFAADNTLANPHGYITIDFGTGCTDTRNNVRKGIIQVEFKGRRFMPNSQIIITLQGYSINGISLEGVRTVTNSSVSLEANPKFTITVQGGKATWPDGTFATREANRTREWIRATNPLNDEWRVTGTAAGTNRDGMTYQMEITKALVYKRECASTNKGIIAVEGTKVLTVDGKVITIDYGTGACDKLITITINGQSKEIEVKGNM